jgi:DnaJ like chaperone protein
MNDFIIKFTPWWGKMFGIIVGYLYAGPYGAMFGILLGNIADRIIFNFLYSPQWHEYRAAATEIQNLFYPALFKVMGHLAKTDGYISEEDISTARKIMNEMRLHGRKKLLAMTYYNQGKLAGFDLHRTLNLIHRLCSHHPRLLKLFALTLYRTAKIDGLNPTKQLKLNIIFSRLGFKPMYQSQRGQYHSPSYDNVRAVDDYTIVGISPKATVKEIKLAYRKKIRLIHPDKLISKGASESEIEKATDETQMLQAAYDRIKSIRGF